MIIGENRTFDHLFATYEPRRGEHVDNLLSKGIVDADGMPGPHFRRATQATAIDAAPAGWQLSPGAKTAYATMPPPQVAGYDTAAPFATVADPKAGENGLAADYYTYLTSGGTGSLTPGAADTRISSVGALAAGPFRLTGAAMTDDDYAGSPVHRFYQDVAAARLQRGASHMDQPFRLRCGPVPLGRADHRRRQQRQPATAGLHR